MGVGIMLILISTFEIWLLYQLLFGTVLDKEYLLKREWGIIWGNIAVMGVLLGINRSLTFFSQGIFVICIVFNCICILFIKKKKPGRLTLTESRPSLIPSAFKVLPENPSLIPEAGCGQSPQKAVLGMPFF